MLCLDKNYISAFKKLYDGVLSDRTIKDAIAAFERSLISSISPFGRSS